ncbi:MAG: hypothetical protein WC666_03305 [Candidatus Paceibacterota bacterium]|jgi:hypothetical protein
MGAEDKTVTGTIQNTAGSQAVSTGGILPDPTIHTPTVTPDNKDLSFKAMVGNSVVDKHFAIQKEHEISLGDIEEPAVIAVLNTKTALVEYVTNKFFLQSIQKPKMERFQIIETFRESKLFFFGERTKIYTITGLLFEGNNLDAMSNTAINNTGPGQNQTVEAGLAVLYRWSSGIQDLYNKYLRGTKLAEQDNIAVLYLEGFMIYGYPLQLQIMQDTGIPNMVQFQMTWAVLREENIGVPNDQKEGTYSLTQLSGKSGAELKKLRIAFNKADEELKQAEKNVDYAQLNWSQLSSEAKTAVYAAKDAALTKRMQAQNAYLDKIASMVQQ